jgi:hypothetical protein
MNQLDAMQIFVRVAELSSFTAAAESLGLPKATVSLAVQQLENLLGTRLLHRTTRSVQLTGRAGGTGAQQGPAGRHERIAADVSQGLRSAGVCGWTCRLPLRAGAGDSAAAGLSCASIRPCSWN